MSKFFLFIIVITILFIDDSVLSLLGYAHKDPNAPSVFKIHPLAYLSLSYFIFLILKGTISFKDLLVKCRIEIYIIVFCAFILLYLFALQRFSALAFIMDALITPAVVSILFIYTKHAYLSKYKYFVVGAFLINFLLSLLEKTFHLGILTQDYMYAFADFRATAIYGHPLNNALIMSTMGILIYLSLTNTFQKFVVLLMNVVALLCFGARGAIIGIVGGVAIATLLDFFNKSLNTSVKNIVVIAASGVIGLIILFNTSLGDRVLKNKNFEKDQSALERVRTLDLLDKMTSQELQWGMTDLETEILMKKGGVKIMENYFVVWVTKFGIYLSLLLLLLIIWFCVKQIMLFDKKAIFPVLFTLLFVASINNSLSTKTRILSVLIVSVNSLRKRVNIGISLVKTTPIAN